MKRFLTGIVLATIVAFFPFSAFAAEFVEQPLFLSKSPVTAGQKVRIFSIISNDSGDAFSGKVVINQNSAVLGSTTVTLATGSTQTVSVSWTPATGGDYLIGAQLVADDGTVVQSVSKTFSIVAAPVPVVPASASLSSSTDLGTAYQPSTPIQQAIAGNIPAVATSSKTVFGDIDAGRSSFVRVLNSQIEQGLVKTGQTGIIATTTHSTSSSSATVPAVSVGFWYYLWLCYLNLLTGLRFLIEKVFVFYAIVVLLVLYIFRKIYKMIFRRRSQFDEY